MIDYICSNSTCLQDAINIAFQMRENKDIENFRATMNDMDNAINSGNLMQIKEYENTLSDIVKHFRKKEVKTKGIKIRGLITPTLKTYFSIAIPVSTQSKKQKINMNFLFDLAKYGLTSAYRANEYLI